MGEFEAFAANNKSHHSIEFQVSYKSVKALNTQIQALTGGKLHVAMSRAAKRAAVHAERIGKQQVRKTYTIDAASIKAATVVYGMRDGAVFSIKGYSKGVEHYKVKKRKRGIFVSIKKGSGDIVPRSFAYNTTFFQREEGEPRFPIRRLYGPAVPQLFENAAIQEKITAEALKKYEERFRHEIERLAGG